MTRRRNEKQIAVPPSRTKGGLVAGIGSPGSADDRPAVVVARGVSEGGAGAFIEVPQRDGVRVGRKVSRRSEVDRVAEAL